MGSFGSMIRKIREGSLKSMSDVAKAMGVSVVYYSDIERGRRNPPLGDKLYRMAESLGLDPKEVEAWAHKERKRVELDLENKASPVSDAALMLAMRWDTITEDEANGIINLLEKKEKNHESKTCTNGPTKKNQGD